MQYHALTLERRPPLAVISLVRPNAGNRVDRLVIEELKDTLERCSDDRGIRVAILAGSGGVFSLGWDPTLIEELKETAAEAAASGLIGRTFQFLVDAPLPVIAALNGDALSAGFELALACDLRVMANTAHLGLPDIAEGRIPMAGGTQRLARLAGRARAVEMILTGRNLDATEALAAGIVGGLAEPEDLLEFASRIGAEIAARGPLAVRLAKEAVHRGLDMPLEQGLRYETDLTVLLQTTADRAEGVRAFVEKRWPNFEGR